MSEESTNAQYALVGSGEFLEVMVPIDRLLLAGRAPRAVFLPTASAPDGAERVDYWMELGRSHFAGMGIEPVGLRVTNRAEADNDDMASQVAGAGLVYLSGGNPGYLAETLRGTAVWAAILHAVSRGAAIAGCSAGAMAMSELAPDVGAPNRPMRAGLAVVGGLAVIPHFDRIRGWVPDIVERYFEARTAVTTVVGIDEETALVGRPGRWIVHGRQSVHVLVSDGADFGAPVRKLAAGEQLDH